MPSKINLEKIFKELDKGTSDQQYEAYTQIKDFIQKSIAAKQKEKETEASDLQSKVDRINGN